MEPKGIKIAGMRKLREGEGWAGSTGLMLGNILKGCCASSPALRGAKRRGWTFHPPSEHSLSVPARALAVAAPLPAAAHARTKTFTARSEAFAFAPAPASAEA